MTVAAFDGGRQFLETVEEDWTLVWSGRRQLVEAGLAAACLPWPAQITEDDVSRGKPHADSYVPSSELNRAQPSDYLAFEDSATGIQSDISAGRIITPAGRIAADVGKMLYALATVQVVAAAYGFDVSLPHSKRAS
jgi:beta-phosphoglucomutase-like phosphatase (HAD superfamily)